MRERKTFKQICFQMLWMVPVAVTLAVLFLKPPPIPSQYWWTVPLFLIGFYVEMVCALWLAQRLTDWTFALIGWLWKNCSRSPTGRGATLRW